MKIARRGGDISTKVKGRSDIHKGEKLINLGLAEVAEDLKRDGIL